MIKEDAEGTPDAALRCVFCAFAPFLFAIFELRMDTRYVMVITQNVSSKSVMRNLAMNGLETCGFTRQGQTRHAKELLACERPSLLEKAVPWISFFLVVVSIRVEGHSVCKAYETEGQRTRHRDKKQEYTQEIGSCIARYKH
jgi:hypothetical protein